MPRSSRHKSHRQSKHSSKDAREHSDSDEDLKMKDRNGKDEGSVRVSKDSASSEKRKLSSGKDPSSHGNGDTSEEYVASKRRKEKADGSAASIRWNGGGERGDDGNFAKESKGGSSRNDSDKSSKSKDLVDSKSKSSRRHENGSSEKKEENVNFAAEKEESKSSSRVDSKRKSEKDSGRKDVQQYKDSNLSKDNERRLERERKIHDIDRETEAPTVDGENTERPIQDELRNPELEKELEKRIRRRKDGSSNKDKYQDDVKESEDRRLSSRSERAKDGRSKDEKHRDGSSGKLRENSDRDNRHRDDKYQEDSERVSRHRDAKYQDDGERDNRRREYHGDGERDNRHGDEKYREDGSRDTRHRDDKYREDGDRDYRRKDNKYHEDGDRDYRHRGEKYREDGDRDDSHRDDRYLEDGNRDGRNKEDIGRDSRHREGKQRDDNGTDKRLRSVKYRDDHSPRDRTGDKSDFKRMRDGSYAAEIHYRKSNNRDGSPIFDDRSSAYRDDKGRRRTSDKEDYGDSRYWGTKEQHLDAEKKSMSSARVELVSDRGRSDSRNAEAENTSNHSRRRSSPSSSAHATKDYLRLSKHEESKYREYVHEENVRHGIASSKEYAGVPAAIEKASLSRSNDKPFQKDDSYLAEFSNERRQKSEARTSPLQMVDKSPSSTSTDRRYLNRTDVRRSLDIEDSGQRSGGGGSRDAREYSGRDGRGTRELPMETLPVDELSQADGDNLSISSPFTRTGHLNSNSRSLLPPPHPFRIGADSPLVLGSFEDDNRGKSNNRYRRVSDSNMGRVQGSPWRAVPSWPSPMANGFMPFQHGPPPVGFHPVMQQFPAPPMFGVRPPMELNHSGVPYHVHDGDRFSGHGRPLGWRNPVDDSCPPFMHGWDANSAVFGDEPHSYERLDGDHNRSLTGGRLWERSGDAWKGQSSGASAELPAATQEEDHSAYGSADEGWAGQSGLPPRNDQNLPNVQSESMDGDQPGDALERSTVEGRKTFTKDMPNLSEKNDADLSHVYLAMIDISSDLTQPELYSEYTNLMGMDLSTDTADDDSKFLLLEEAVDAAVKTSNRTSSASLFSTTNNSAFQKAMSLYKKLREEVGAVNGDKISFSNMENLEPSPMEDRAGSGDTKSEQVISACDHLEAEGAISTLSKVQMELSPEKADETDKPVLDSQEILEDSISALQEVKVELYTVPKRESLDIMNIEDKSMSPENVENSHARSPGKVEEVNQVSDSGGMHSDTNDGGLKLYDSKYGALLVSEVVSAEACEVVKHELVESGSVNLSRIHQSPESTH